MKSLVVVPLILFLAACGETPTTFAPDGIPQVADQASAANHGGNGAVLIVSAGGRIDASGVGGGTVVPDDPPGVHTFTAMQKTNGDVSGHGLYSFKRSSFDFYDNIRYDIVCLWVEGDTAYMGTVVTKAGVPAVVGWEMMFMAVDGGEGDGAQDYVSDLNVLYGNDCTDPDARAGVYEGLSDFDAIFPYAGNVQIVDNR